MGEILKVDFRAPRKLRDGSTTPLCQDPTLKDMVEAPEVRKPVDDMLKKLGLKDYDGLRAILGVPINYTTVDQDTDVTFGTCDLVVSPGQKGRRYLVATTQFPITLMELGVPEDRAFFGAAVYARVYEALMTHDTSPALSGLRPDIVRVAPHIRNYWRGETDPKERDICRIAAGASLLMCHTEATSISVPETPSPYPNWIAAFIDPADAILKDSLMK